VKDRQTRLLPLIAAFKITKAGLLFALAMGLGHLRHGSPGYILAEWAHAIRVDPENRLVHGIISKITGASPASLHQLEIGTFFYGLLFLVEGTGLLLRQRWAEYMTILTTATFLPLEFYELFFTPRHRLIKAGALLLNAAILFYLVVNLIKARLAATEARLQPSE
jgi:uncharacterized membrane protein (DUF2068 family)